MISHFAELPDQKEASLTKVAQFCEECIAGRTPLYDVLRETFYTPDNVSLVSPIATMLASIPALLVVTTNYDNYVEAAFASAGRPFSVVTHITNREHSKWGFLLIQNSENPSEVVIKDPSDLVIADYTNRTLIYKIHGTFGPETAFNPEVDTIVITEDDYIDFMVMTELRKFPPAFAREFQRKHFLFLGYSLEDWNFRVILRKIQLTAELGQEYQSWAIQLKPSDMEQRFWGKRRVDVYDMDLAEFTGRVSKLLPK